MNRNPLLQVKQFGQSIWLDFLSRELIRSGGLKNLIENEGVSGITSNPSIFEKAIAQSSDYDAAIRRLSLKQGKSPRPIYEELVIADIQDAADLLAPVYEKTQGVDGYVSLEVSTLIARDTGKTIDEARRLWQTVGRRNVMIKIPGTSEGIEAIAASIADGINVNVTLLFGLPRYREVADAYMKGMEDLARRGGDLRRIRSVASFFLSRIDVLLDPRLEELEKKGGETGSMAHELRGRAAIASAKLAYEMYGEIFGGSRFRALQEKGARKQWLLWASTSTKSKEYSDVKYVEALIGPETVNTMPRETLDAYRNHGSPARRLDTDIGTAHSVMRHLASLGIDIDEITRELEADGIGKFSTAFEKLLAGIGEKSRLLMAA